MVPPYHILMIWVTRFWELKGDCILWCIWRVEFGLVDSLELHKDEVAVCVCEEAAVVAGVVDLYVLTHFMALS
jgi:hypothetical protein